MQPHLARVAAAASLTLTPGLAHAQASFGAGCAGASGVTPELAISGPIQSGQPFTLEVTAPGGLGLGYLLIGLSKSNASALGGVGLPLDIGVLLSDPLWTGCDLLVDPVILQPYTFDPTANGGTVSFSFPGFASGRVFVQALNVDPDFTTRVAGLSAGLDLIGLTDLAPGMVPIAPGTFQMGSTAAPGPPYQGSFDEQRKHGVELTYWFWMGQHEVTQSEYGGLIGSNPSLFVGTDHPVEQVNWHEAMAYAAALTAQEAALGLVPAGYEYRLPTEAEWEYACRAGTTTEFNVGDALFCPDACFWKSEHSGLFCTNPFGSAPVEGYAPNAWGLYDMHGNVWEWCLDANAQYPLEDVIDPFVDIGSGRIIRGGGWQSNSGSCRSAVRNAWNPDISFSTTGFRIVLAPILTP